MKRFFVLFLIVLLLVGLVPPVLAYTEPEMEEMPEFEWTELHLAYMQGDTYGNFRPMANITRAEVSAILARTFITDFVPGELPAGMEAFDFFVDVHPDDWFFYYVAWAYHEGLILGSPPNAIHPYPRFRPGYAMRRDEVVAALVRVDGAYEISEPAPFLDWEQTFPWARPYIYTAYQKGWVFGAGGYFRPLTPITRAEVATIVNRILGRVTSMRDLEHVEVENLGAARNFLDVSVYEWYFAAVLAATSQHELRRAPDWTVRWMHFV
ncbi:MAG: S-layer homology domain-containing protein [Oscillospiraceae bacterium]|nr:S-layer homology domain-containing protein [Oscillospiraceae bacterium]